MESFRSNAKLSLIKQNFQRKMGKIIAFHFSSKLRENEKKIPGSDQSFPKNIVELSWIFYDFFEGFCEKKFENDLKEIDNQLIFNSKFKSFSSQFSKEFSQIMIVIFLFG